MKSTDKFLVGIVVSIVLLVGVAFAVAFLRPKPAYLPEDTPEAVAQNYLLALQQADYERAYRYLSPTLEGYPASPEALAEDIRDYAWNFRLDEDAVALEVASARVTGDRATVTVRETRFYQDGLFNSGQFTDTFEMQLRRDAPGGAWQIVEAGTYWALCWNDADGCR